MKPIGRNEPCPCGSGKKYKRCCGVSAAPQLSVPKQSPAGGWDPSMLEDFDPQMAQQFTQALQRLPKGQLQRLQSMMQRAMNGKDVSAEAAEFEKTLPADFQQIMQTWGMAAASSLGQMPGDSPAISSEPSLEVSQGSANQDSAEMTEEKARELVARAIADGTLSQEQGAALLGNSVGNSAPTESNFNLRKFWKNK